ncbi:hypothetical protein LWI28_004048 [Acer negundo]|uniref:Uncharacterized protein n=1 Tax=Acer negundo TaxID=4023 RepID=A0AAD5NWE3_ACENE|nr:hypothetical protein LWI28_004048 [Acer negundo]
MTLIKEFYASMDPDVVKKGGPVLVRDHEFKISVKMINAHFSTPNFVDLSKGYEGVDVPKTEQLLALRGPANARQKGRKRRRTVGSDQKAEYDFEGLDLESDEEDVDYEADSGRSKLDQILNAVQSLHSRMDSFEDEIRRHLRMPVYLRRAAGVTRGISISEARAAQRAAAKANLATKCIN